MTDPEIRGRPYRYLIIRAWMILALLGAAGCATPSVPEPVTRPMAPPVASDASTAAALRTEIQSWLGTPHRTGGLNRRGVDCSGLVMVLYDRLFGIRLPRTTVSQMRTGHRVSQAELVPGDLVFFKPKYKVHHVGIYLGDLQFVHTSSSRGVIVSRVDDVFWRECYLTGRRLLHPPQ